MAFDFASFRDNVASKNAALLQDLDIKLPTAILPKSSPSKKPSTPKPKKVATPSRDAPPASAEQLVKDRETRGLRSSPRVRDSMLGLTPKKEPRARLSSDGDDEEAEEASYYEGGKKVRTSGGAPEKLGKRLYNPKRFGAIPGVAVLTHFGFRMEASTAACHAPVVAGIAGSSDGCWSICVSGGYDGDVDLGERLTFSGSGGRDLKGTDKNPKNLRTAEQSSDQLWTNPLNASLLKSVETQKPIRVLRGFKGKSCYAPLEGYRYDGLYVAAKAWQDTGKTGFKICRVALVRLPGQPPVPIQPGRESEAGGLLPTTAIDGTSSSSSSARATPASGAEESTPATSPEPTPSADKAARSPAKRKAMTAAEADEAEEGSPMKRRRSTRGA
ncbi:hypothetical protein JCM10207_000755 [Rhodosporidiobolus poonsookiae]